MTELLNCPFCGKSNLRAGDNTGPTDDYGMSLDSFIECEANECSSMMTNLDFNELVKKWNTRADGWIKVSDRLPEKSHVDVLLFSNRSGFTAGFAASHVKGRRFYSLDGLILFNENEITHWQPLPHPPKD